MKSKIVNLPQRPYSRGNSVKVTFRYDIPFSGRSYHFECCVDALCKYFRGE